MIFKGTDKDAFKKAASGKTPKKRSKIYQKEKAKNEKRRKRKEASQFSLSSFIPKIPKQTIRIMPTTAKTMQARRITKYVEKRTILDDVRDYRSSKIVSNISNSLATFVVKCGGRQWDNDTKNLVRSSIALAVSEVTNKALEKPLEIIENIKLFIKVGKTIYKIIAWIDKVTNLWVTDDKSISIASENDADYIGYIRQYPRLVQYIQTNLGGSAMKYKVGDIVALNNGQTVYIFMINEDSKEYHVTSTDDDSKEYIVKECDISHLVMHT